MATGINPIRMEDLIANLTTQLQAKCSLPQDCVFETLADEEAHIEHPPADRFILLQPLNFKLDRPIWDGSGRFLPTYCGRVRVATVVRFAADQEFRNVREIRDKVRSAMALSLKVIDALSGFTMPVTPGSSNNYLSKAMHNDDVDVKPKRIGKTAWSVIASTWIVPFVLILPSGTGNP